MDLDPEWKPLVEEKYYKEEELLVERGLVFNAC